MSLKIIEGKVLVGIYIELGKYLTDKSVCTDFHGSVKKQGDSILAGNDDVIVCGESESWVLAEEDMANLKDFEKCTAICSRISKEVASKVIPKLISNKEKLSSFAGTVISKGSKLKFIYGIGLSD